MSARNWLPTVLRARNAQEDLAARRVAMARRDAGAAAVQRDEQQARVAALGRPGTGTVAQFQAELASQQQAAATLAASTNRLMFAEARVATGLRELTEAATARRTVERLHERDQEQQQRSANDSAQREQDEVSISRHAAVRRAAG
jgi:flagellar biosynthesis chaperone FliJ